MAEDMLTTLVRWVCPLILNRARLHKRYPFFTALTRIVEVETDWTVDELVIVDALYMLCVQRALLHGIWLQGLESRVYDPRTSTLRRDWIDALSDEIYALMLKTVIRVIDEGEAGERHKGFAIPAGGRVQISLQEADRALPFDISKWKFVRRDVPRCPDDVLRYETLLKATLPEIGPFSERCIVAMGAQKTLGDAPVSASSLIYKALLGTTQEREKMKGTCSCLEKAWLAAHLAQQFAILQRFFKTGSGARLI